MSSALFGALDGQLYMCWNKPNCKSVCILAKESPECWEIQIFGGFWQYFLCKSSKTGQIIENSAINNNKYVIIKKIL